MSGRTVERVVKGGVSARLPRHVRDARDRRRRRARDARGRRSRASDHGRASCAARCPTTSIACMPTDRLLEPLIRDGREGRGALPPGGWDEALDLVAERLRAAIAAHGAETVLPYSYLGTMGFLQRDSMSARVLQRARRERARAHDLRRRRASPGCWRRTASRPRSIRSAGRSARYVLCWGWNPMSTAPHLWRLHPRRAARRARKLVVVDPFRSRTARVADEHLRPLPGHRRARSRWG